MAGHSKWANIKFRKAGQDKKRGKIFTKLIREVTVAVQMGGDDASSNPRLRAAMDKALGSNMTRDTINRAVKRAAGAGSAENLMEIRYEGYGPGGVAVMVDCLTDNRNRTVADVRHAFTKCGGSLGTDGSVSYIFNKIGMIIYPPDSDEDAIMETALEAGAEDIINHEDGSIEVRTDEHSMLDVKEALQAAGHEPAQGEVTMIASTDTTLDLDGAEKLMRMQNMLEDSDDVQEVYTNANIPDAILEQISEE